MLNKFSVSTQLTLGFAGLILLMLCMSMLSIYQMGRINESLRHITDVNDVKKDLAHNIRFGLDSRSIAVRDVIVFQGSERAQALERLKANRQDMNELTKKFSALASDKGETEALEKMRLADEKVVSLSTELIAAAEANRKEEAESGLTRLRLHIDEVRSAIKELVAHEEKQTSDSIQASQTLYEQTRALQIGLLILASLLSAAFTLFVTRSITQPVGRVLSAVERIAKGDLSVQLSPQGSDEFARLESGVQSMNQELAQAIHCVRHGADLVAHTSESLSRAVKEVSHGTDTQADASSAMAAALEEMSASILQVAELSEHARSLAVESSNGAALGSGHIGSMVKEINRVSATIEDSASHAHKLGAESERISSIVGVIKEVADQTNLLALNAAIEAARAGEMGRGFAVVADEVRKLAERSAGSAQEITMMVSTIQDRSRNMSTHMENTVTQMSSGLSLAHNAGDAMRGIDAGAKEVTELIDKVALALKEQSSASEDLSHRVEKVVQMVDENAVAVHSVAHSADQLKALSSELVNSVSHFKLGR